jgi:CubicO group peptidase (beta-lactamase class C family)
MPTRKTVIRVMLWGLASLALVGIVVPAVYIYLNWTYLSRILTYPKETPVTSVQWYKPMEVIRGGPGSALPVARPDEVEVAPEALEKAAAWAEKKNSSALLVLHKDRIVFEKYWRGHDANAQSNSMSMAKSVLGLLIGIAINEGQIQFEDEPAADYLPEWKDDVRNGITIKHLLQMSSGLGVNEEQYKEGSDTTWMHFGPDVPSIVFSMPLEGEPGRQFVYHSANTQILSIILERATQRRYADYLSEKLWTPLGASNAQVWLDRSGGTAKTYCCLFATARDWARLGLLVLHQGEFAGRQLVPREWIQKMITPSPREPDYGYQIWLAFPPGGIRSPDRDEPFLANDMVYFDGRDKQRVFIIPSYDLIIVRLGENARGFDEAFLPNTIVRGLSADHPKPECAPRKPPES